jgi:CxxC motif-containing protein (DUF1111 family)
MPNMRSPRTVGLLFCGFLSLGIYGARHSVFATESPDANQESLKIGKELFTREWLPNDKRSFAGDGLGPVHNARSCVACHHQGGVGGAGPRGANSIIVSAFVEAKQSSQTLTSSGIPPEDMPNPLAPYPQPNREELAKVHPALRTDHFFVLHREGNDQAFDNWRTKILERIHPRFIGNDLTLGTQFVVGGVLISLIRSERNTPTLFGLSWIEKIAEDDILAVAAEQTRTARLLPEDLRIGGNNRTPVQLPISGRALRLKNKKIGRFGWKSSVASIREFTMLACATELGLEVPGMHRSPPPWIENYHTRGLDLNESQLNCLVNFVQGLPRPTRQRPDSAQQAAIVDAGKKTFAYLGCANCHRPTLGGVDGIFSDLLLHDMGQSLSGAGDYQTTLEVAPTKDVADPLAISGNFALSKSKEVLPRFGAGAREWRTPPLWGLRDSAPYLHDGRAKSIEEAITQHDGEGLLAADAFKNLSEAERFELCTFLESLRAPVPAQ